MTEEVSEGNGATPRDTMVGVGTETIIVEQIYGGSLPHPLQLLAASLLFSSVGIAVARHLFEGDAGAIGVLLCVLGLLPTLDHLVDRHKASPAGLSPVLYLRADMQLASRVLTLFAGVMLAYAIWSLLLPVEQVRHSFHSQLAPWLRLGAPGFEPGFLTGIWTNNLLVLVGVLLLSALYRTGGALLVLAWNASVWGATFALIARLQSGDVLGKWLVVSACVFPHVLFEAVGYILMALCGLGVVRLIARYRDPSLERVHLIRKVALLGGAAVACVLVAGLLEKMLAAPLVSLVGQINDTF